MSEGPLPTVEIPKAVSSSQDAAAPQPSATAQMEGGEVIPSAPPSPSATLQDEPVVRRLAALHSVVVEQTQRISGLRTRLAELEKRIEDFNKRSPHSI